MRALERLGGKWIAAYNNGHAYIYSNAGAYERRVRTPNHVTRGLAADGTTLFSVSGSCCGNPRLYKWSLQANETAAASPTLNAAFPAPSSSERYLADGVAYDGANIWASVTWPTSGASRFSNRALLKMNATTGADGYLSAIERGESEEQAESYASARSSVYYDSESQARAASVDEEPARAFALTLADVYGDASERREYQDREQDIESAVSTYTAAVDAGDSPGRAAVYAAAYVAAIARGDAPEQAASYAADYADANAAAVYRNDAPPGTEAPSFRDLSLKCCH